MKYIMKNYDGDIIGVLETEHQWEKLHKLTFYECEFEPFNPTAASESPRVDPIKDGKAIAKWKQILEERDSDNMVWHRPTIAAMLKDFCHPNDQITGPAKENHE